MVGPTHHPPSAEERVALDPLPFGRYYLVRQLGVGGMARTFKAKLFSSHGFTKTLVLKRILSDHARDPFFVQMFIDEAKVAAQLSHPNIVSVYDFGQNADTYYIAMEYVNGRTLADVLAKAKEKSKRIPVELAVRIVSEVARGLHHAHTRADDHGEPLNIVHRDANPSNILLSFEGEVKITDFGVAKAESNKNQTDHGSLKGKHSYMSPEQAVGESVDRRSDVFTLATVLYETLTGERLFKRDTVYLTLAAIVDGEIPVPSSSNPHVTQELDGVVARALVRDPSKRTPSALRLAHELSMTLSAEELEASSTNLSKYLCALFADEIEAERGALTEERRWVDSVLASQDDALPDGSANAAAPGTSGPGMEHVTVSEGRPSVSPNEPTMASRPGNLTVAAAGGTVSGPKDDHTQPSAGVPRKRILIVDDLESMREVIKVYLLGNDFEYHTADDGSEALAKAREIRPDLIISDIRMPRMSGTELCRELKADPTLSYIPVVLVSAKPDSSFTEADCFLAKPIQADELAQVARKLLNRGRRR